MSSLLICLCHRLLIKEIKIFKFQRRHNLTLKKCQHDKEHDRLVYFVDCNFLTRREIFLTQVELMPVEIEEGAAEHQAPEYVAAVARLPDPPGAPEWEEDN